MSKKKRKIKTDHSQCECMIKQRGPHWGLFCIPHNHWFKWVSPAELNVIRQMDIPMLIESK